MLQWQLAHQWQGADGRDAGDARHLFDEIDAAIAQDPTGFSLGRSRRRVDLDDHGGGDIESGIAVSEVDETAREYWAQSAIIVPGDDDGALCPVRAGGN